VEETEVDIDGVIEVNINPDELLCLQSGISLLSSLSCLSHVQQHSSYVILPASPRPFEQYILLHL